VLSLGSQAKPSLGKVQQKMKELRKPCGKAECFVSSALSYEQTADWGQRRGMKGTRGAGK